MKLALLCLLALLCDIQARMFHQPLIQESFEADEVDMQVKPFIGRMSDAFKRLREEYRTQEDDDSDIEDVVSAEEIPDEDVGLSRMCEEETFYNARSGDCETCSECPTPTYARRSCSATRQTQCASCYEINPVRNADYQAKCSRGSLTILQLGGMKMGPGISDESIFTEVEERMRKLERHLRSGDMPSSSEEDEEDKPEADDDITVITQAEEVKEDDEDDVQAAVVVDESDDGESAEQEEDKDDDDDDVSDILLREEKEEEELDNGDFSEEKEEAKEESDEEEEKKESTEDDEEEDENEDGDFVYDPNEIDSETELRRRYPIYGSVAEAKADKKRLPALPPKDDADVRVLIVEASPDSKSPMWDSLSDEQKAAAIYKIASLHSRVNESEREERESIRRFGSICTYIIVMLVVLLLIKLYWRRRSNSHSRAIRRANFTNEQNKMIENACAHIHFLDKKKSKSAKEDKQPIIEYV